MTDEEKIIDIIEKLRPFLIGDGGDIEFVKYEDNIVYIKMLGACAGCSLIDYTLKDGVESAIKEEVPGVKKVVNISWCLLFYSSHSIWMRFVFILHIW